MRYGLCDASNFLHKQIYIWRWRIKMLYFMHR